MSNKAVSVYAEALKRQQEEGQQKAPLSPVVKTKPKINQPKTGVPPRNHDTTQPRNHDTTVSRYHDTTIESIRKAVKELGKEAATHRFTVEEKKAVADLVYAYKNRGVRTSENQITRIAINFILHDHKEKGKNGVLDRALKALNE